MSTAGNSIDEAICVANVPELAPCIDDAGREAIEREDHLLYRWWRVDEFRRSGDRFYPRSLPQHIDALIAGLNVDEPFETWDDLE